MLINFDDYLKSIKEYLPIAKSGNRSRFLQKNTTASLRNYSLFLFDEGLNSADEFNFKYFFQVKNEDDIRKGIQKFDTDKLKPIKNFIDGKTGTPSQDNLELIAILIDFNPRPFKKFSKGDSSQKVINEVENIPIKKGEIIEKKDELIIPHNNNFKKKLGIGVLSLFGLMAGGYTTKDLLFPEKECMQWQNDHYELVDCKNENLRITNFNEPKPYNEVEFKREKLKVCDTTTFFKSKKAIVWYSKENHVVEFFNMDGVNPDTGDELKQISQYMIDKYVEPCK